MTPSTTGNFAALLVTIALLTALCAPALAQQRTVPESPVAIKQSFAPVVKKAAPAVVNVYVQHRVEQTVSPFLDDPFFRQFFGDSFGIPRERIQNSLGSGVLVSPEGLVVTNNHVIQGSGEAEITVALSDGREFPAKIILKDEQSDLAILRLDAKGVQFPSIVFSDSDTLEVGDLVLAIGDPFGVGQTVTSGIVSALARTQVGISDYQFFIQTDAAINPGNSGGALVDLNGNLIGINTAIYSRTGGSIGIGFAIPVNMVRVVIASAKGGGSVVRRPWLGAKLQAVTPEIADSLGLKRPAGALVAGVSNNSPAARAGLKTGDLIVAVDTQPVDDPNAFDYRFATKPLGGQTQIVVVRNGRETRLVIALQSAPEAPREELVIQSRSPFLGVKVANLSPALAEELKLDPTTEGVAIVDIASGSIAESLGFQRGDVVLSVNNTAIAHTRDLDRATRDQSRLWRVSVSRNGQQMSVVFGG